MRSIRAITFFLVMLLISFTFHTPATAASLSPFTVADGIRTNLLQAQLLLSRDKAQAQAAYSAAQSAYSGEFATILRRAAPQSDTRIQSAFAQSTKAVEAGDTTSLILARTTIWTAMLDGATHVIDQAIQSGDLATARAWMTLREFRQATRFSRPNANATLALREAENGTLPPAEAWLRIRADLFDTYQARLNETLQELQKIDAKNSASHRIETAGLAEGYFTLLAPIYTEQRGAAATATVQQSFLSLREAASTDRDLAPLLNSIDSQLQGFRAAPLSNEEQSRRAGQLFRYLGLVPIEYGRGVRGGEVIKELEIREAITFQQGATAAFTDLRPLLEARNPAASAQIVDLLQKLDQTLTATGTGTSIAAPEDVQAQTDALLSLLRSTTPQEWQQSNSSADFDVIASSLDQMEQAVKAGQYDLAESARLEAYAILETGPEARLTAFAPQYVTSIEDMFWYGQGEQFGLAYQIEHKATPEQVAASRAALDKLLAAAQKSLIGESAPVAIISNAALIVFREGLEAVLILASLMGSFKSGEQRKLRIPLWWGAITALLVTVLTWMLARETLTALARFGAALEAVVSLIAVAILLLIMNWFVHDAYWNGWLSNFHQQKKRIVKGSASQWIGLITLGFTSIYREGFESVLFLQALVLASSNAIVLSGVALGFGLTMLVGVAVFMLQAKLPHKKMLIVTGVLIGAVLLQMVGNTAHALQVVGWLSTHPIRGLSLPFWSGMWLGVYATWEGIGLQLLAGAFTIGSYFLAEYMHKRDLNKAIQAGTAKTAQTEAQNAGTLSAEYLPAEVVSPDAVS